jgi:hypothetical protein
MPPFRKDPPFRPTRIDGRVGSTAPGGGRNQGKDLSSILDADSDNKILYPTRSGGRGR